MSITLLAAAKCPMGCGTTLEVNDLGTLRCFAQDCPRPDAAELILSTTETEHLVLIGSPLFSYTIQHPLKERLEGQLFECPYAPDVSDNVHKRMERPGIYRVERDDLQKLMWTFLDGPDAQLR